MRIQIQMKSIPVFLMLFTAMLLLAGNVFAQDTTSSGAVDPLSVEGVVAARNAIRGGGGVVHDQGNKITPAPSAGKASSDNYFSGGKFETFSHEAEQTSEEARASYRYRVWQSNWD